MSNKIYNFHSDFVILYVWNVLVARDQAPKYLLYVSKIDETHEIDESQISIRPHLKDTRMYDIRAENYRNETISPNSKNVIKRAS